MELELTFLEYEVLDELYFVQNFDSLEKNIKISKDILREVVVSLYQKEYIKLLDISNNEIDYSTNFIGNDFFSFQFVISKKGLFAHNSR